MNDIGIKEIFNGIFALWHKYMLWYLVISSTYYASKDGKLTFEGNFLMSSDFLFCA